VFSFYSLIPNLGYLSEAATSLIDRRLQLNIVPFTDVIHMSSPTFHYDHGDRKANDPRKPSPRPLPAKIGSFQCFLNDFNDASVFLRNHPFPPDAFYSNSRSLSKKRSTVFSCLGGNEDDDDDDDEENQQEMQHQDPQYQHFQGTRVFQWTRKLQLQFKREFENLAIMDYLIRNTGIILMFLIFKGDGGHIKNSYTNRI
jgi:Phosphatidylinositol 3- and 4-kinase